MEPTYISNFETEYRVNDFINLPWMGSRGAKSGEIATALHKSSTKYNGFTIDSSPMTWPIVDVMQKLNYTFGYFFNTCVLNKYDTEDNGVSWHTDKYEGMDYGHDIAIISYGAERDFWWKPMDQVGQLIDRQKIFLTEGSLLIMPGGFQEKHLHCIPKHDKPCTTRISLTFRRFYQ